MIRNIDVPSFLRNFKIMNDGEIDFFLGSGASIQSGIPTCTGLIWEFKRTIYCTETETSQEKFKDLQSKYTQKYLQEYFDAQKQHPPLYDNKEYSHYFELCYNTNLARERFIQNKVRDILPSLGHLCLADLFINKKINCVWTTNFDELIENGIKTLKPEYSFNVLSSANNSLQNKSKSFSSIYKLHGDYRYDRIKNTLSELQKLEKLMENEFTQQLFNKGIVFVGYSGNDNSIMTVLEENIKKPNFLSSGLFWMCPNISRISDRVRNLFEIACEINKSSGIIEISGFDEIIYHCYKLFDRLNPIIEDRWKDYPKHKKPLYFSAKLINSFIKLNTFISTDYPLCKAFDTDISSWKELKSIIGDSDTIAALYAKRIYCFDEEENIKKIFDSHIISEIYDEKIEKRIMYKEDSIYTGMLYKLIGKKLINEIGLTEFKRNTYYDKKLLEIKNQYKIFEAIEVFLSTYDEKYFLSILPTFYVLRNDDIPISKIEKQNIINEEISKLLNVKYNEKLKNWNYRLINSDNNLIQFKYKGFILNFKRYYLSSGGFNRKKEWPVVNSYKYDEPEMLFSAVDSAKKTINQLKGITKYGPIDYSYSKTNSPRKALEIAIISPTQQLEKILEHLNSLNKCLTPFNSQEGFLPPYNNFESVYRRGINIPYKSDSSKILVYDEREALSKNSKDFLLMLKSFIDRFAIQNDLDVVVIYIPEKFKKFRLAQSDNDDFNLHDALKLHATDKSIKLQFIEEKSLNTNDLCKVIWALSTSFYAKASGILWHPLTLNNSTAFVGISYAQSMRKGICIGCSQLFDSTGTGIRLLLRKINEPAFYGKNPFMKCDDARNLMSALREQYYKCDPTSRLDRIVVHKTTCFTQEEIKGFTQALEGIDDIELLQIQEYSKWRAIRGSIFKSSPDNYPIKRGTVIQLNNDSFLIWTHGSVIHDELLGKLNYYKGGRGIPAPLLVKRFYGKASGDIIVKEILMLTKMNWNSGDNLYKYLPVTLDFAKILSRMSKQDEAMYDKAYDFRYFM